MPKEDKGSIFAGSQSGPLKNTEQYDFHALAKLNCLRKVHP